MDEIVEVVVFYIFSVTTFANNGSTEIKHGEFMNYASLRALAINHFLKTFTLAPDPLFNISSMYKFQYAHHGFRSITFVIKVEQFLQIEKFEKFSPYRVHPKSVLWNVLWSFLDEQL